MVSSASRLAAAAAVCGAACSVAVGAETIQIDGAGATFPYPIYSKWFAEYTRLHPDVRINYQSIGSGGGLRQMRAQTVFFGASDIPLTAEQMQTDRMLHLPTVLGAVVPVYDIPNVRAALKFTGPVLADIFLGKITKWNDAAIATLNEGVTLPAADITVAHRADGSGTTYVWADYLAKVSSEWRSRVGVGSAVNWPTGVGARGNEGVAGLVSQIPGSIGYVELIYALQNKLTHGTVRNAAGEFVTASVATMNAAAATSVTRMPADFRVSITNASGAGAYPIASYTWILLYESPKDAVRARAMVDFLRWALTDGQKYCADLGYAPLPEGVAKMELAALAKVKTS